MKLLLADDDPLFRRLLHKLLAPDYEIISVEDGAEAWEALRRPDLERYVTPELQESRKKG